MVVYALVGSLTGGVLAQHPVEEAACCSRFGLLGWLFVVQREGVLELVMRVGCINVHNHGATLGIEAAYDGSPALLNDAPRRVR